MNDRITLVLMLAGYVPYILGIFGKGLWGRSLKDRLQPSIVSWGTWLLLDVIMLGGMIDRGAVSGLMIAAAIGAAAVLIALVVARGRIEWTSADKFALYGAGCSIAVWFILQSPGAAIAVPAVVLLIGAIPGLRAAKKDGSVGGMISWATWFVASMVSLGSVHGPSPFIIDAVQPFAFMFITLLMMSAHLLGVRDE